MTFYPTSINPFENYFQERAQLADEMASQGHATDSHTLSTASLDALAEIWLHDFPTTKQKLESELGGAIPASIRLARFLKQFVPNDPRVSKVAVICFAEDWKHYRPQDTQIANQLLYRRLSNNPDEFLRAHEPPKSYLDVSRAELAEECAEFGCRPDLFALAEEYEYGALLYSFYRCPLVHVATNSNRTHGFAKGEEVKYYWSLDVVGVATIGFGSSLATCWLRNAVSSYVQTCEQQNIVPANNINAGISQEDRFKKRWSCLKN